MRAYPKYKDSGVEWLGDIPEHWQEMKLKHLANVVLGKMLTPNDKGGYFLKPYLRAKNLNWLVVDSNDIKKMWFSEYELDIYRLKTNDLLVSEGGEVGRTCIWQEEIPECYIQNSVNRVRLYNENVPKFFLFLFYLYGYLGAFDSIVSRVSIAHLTKEKLNDVRFLLPPLKEQKAIATYLDRKTSQIDSLIEKKKRMIELLKEERAAIINRAVTKGINPDAEMKDSGVEWLGEVPKGWKIKKLKYVLEESIGGGTPSKNKPEYWVGDIPWVSPKDMKSEIVSDSIDKISFIAVEESTTNLIPVNSVVIVVRSGILKHTVPVAITKNEVTLNQDMKALIPYSNLSSVFLFYLIKGMQNELLTFTTKMGATVDSIEFEYLMNFFISLPPIEEQETITDYICEKLNNIDKTVEIASKEISLIEEYRTALINESVTGKIDVRECLNYDSCD